MITYKLRSWIPFDNTKWHTLCKNPMAIDMIKNELESSSSSNINWQLLSGNINACDILKKNIDKINYYEILLNNWVNLFKYDGGVDINFKIFDDKLFEKVLRHYVNIHIVTLNALGFNQFVHILENIKYNTIEDKILLFAGRDVEYFKLIHYNKYYLENYKDIIIKNHRKIDWTNISTNLNDIDLLNKYINYLDWESLSLNPHAISILEKNIEKIHWDNLSLNSNSGPIIENNLDILDDIHWQNLSACLNSIKILKDNKDKLNYYYLPINIHAVDLVEEIIDNDINSIDLNRLLSNKNAIHLIEKYYDKIFIKSSSCDMSMGILYKNPAIFTYDYDKMKNNKKLINEDIIKYWYHPKKIEKYLQFNDDIDDYLNIFN